MRVVSASYGGGGYSDLASEAIASLGRAGVLFVAAAGNGERAAGTGGRLQRLAVRLARVTCLLWAERRTVCSCSLGLTLHLVPLFCCLCRGCRQ